VVRRVVVLSQDTGLVSVAAGLIANGDRLVRYDSPLELAGWADIGASVVMLDAQPRARQLLYKQLRDHYRGPVIMLLDHGDARPALPSDAALRFLYRPFKVTDLSGLLAAPPAPLGPLETAVIAAWSRRSSSLQAPPSRRRGLSYRISWTRSSRRRARTAAAALVVLLGLLGTAALFDPGRCGRGCQNQAGASESPVPLTSGPAGPAGPGRGGSGSSAADPGTPPPAVPPVTGAGGLIDSISPITASDTSFTPPAAPPGVPPPANASPSPLPGAPSTTAPPTTAPPTTAPPTTEPPTTEPPTTEPPTTAPPTTPPASTTAEPTTT
jgi:hypothetical protein